MKENGLLDNSYRTWTAEPKVPGSEICGDDQLGGSIPYGLEKQS